MGDFLSTCMISQVPIKVGEPVRLILMTARPTLNMQAGGFDDETALWAPVCLPLRASYDWYGGVEQVADDWASRLLASYFAWRHGVTLDVEHVTAYLDEHPLIPVHNATRRERYGFALIPESIYVACVSAMGDWHNLAQRWPAMVRDYLMCHQLPPGQFGTTEQMDHMLEVDMLHRAAPSGEFMLTALVAEPEPESLQAVADFGLLWIALRRLHKLFQPQVVSGSQDPWLAIHRAVSSAALAYCDAAAWEYDSDAP